MHQDEQIPKLRRKILERKIGLPNPFYAWALRTITKFIIKKHDVKFIYHFDKKEMKGKQVILISDHASRDNFYFTLGGYPFVNPNIVVGYPNLFKPHLFKPLLKIGVIPKWLYSADYRAAMDIQKLISMGASICVFTEGVQSVSGAMHPMNPATIKFLKSSNLDVVLCSSKGAYLNRNRFSSVYKYGHMEFEYRVLFTKEETQTMSEEEMYQRYLKYFQYNDFAWNEEHQYSYKGKEPTCTGIEKILYICPKCGKEYTLSTKGEHIICSNCGNDIYVDDKYNLIPEKGSECKYKRIDRWFLAQREAVRELVKNPNFVYRYKANLMELHEDKIYKEKMYRTGSGEVIITHEGISYSGSRFGEPFFKFFNLKTLPCALFSPKEYNEMHYENKVWALEPYENLLSVTKIMLMSEELHNLLDPLWRRVCLDAYK